MLLGKKLFNSSVNNIPFAIRINEKNKQSEETEKTSAKEEKKRKTRNTQRYKEHFFQKRT